MSVKENIIDRINKIDDTSVLNEILHLVQSKSEKQAIYHFSYAEKQAVTEGLADLDAGKFYTNEEANKLVSKLLSEQSIGLKEH